MPSKIYKAPNTNYGVEQDLLDEEIGIWLAYLLQVIRLHTNVTVEVATSEEFINDRRFQYVAINMVKQKFVPKTLAYFECVNHDQGDPKHGEPQLWQICLEPEFLTFLRQFKEDWPRRLDWSPKGMQHNAQTAAKKPRRAFLDPIGDFIRGLRS